MKTKTKRVVAYATDNDWYKITITEEYLGDGWTENTSSGWGETFRKYRYTVTMEDIEEYSEWGGEIESHSYRDIAKACEKFKELIAIPMNGLKERTIKTVFLCDGFEEDYDEDLDPYYDRRSERLDYAGHPWDAPGMSVRDFCPEAVDY